METAMESLLKGVPRCNRTSKLQNDRYIDYNDDVSSQIISSQKDKMKRYLVVGRQRIKHIKWKQETKQNQMQNQTKSDTVPYAGAINALVTGMDDTCQTIFEMLQKERE